MPKRRQRPPFGHTVIDYLSLVPPRKITPMAVRALPKGDGGAVLVLPGLLHDDRQTEQFRRGLAMLGYTPFAWELGPNYGPTRPLMDGATARLTRLAREHGALRLVGYSMGGLFARWLAHARPHTVRQVVTVCTPFRDALQAFWLPAGGYARHLWPHVDTEALAFMVARPPDVPWGSVYSPRDGVAAWQACVEPGMPERCTAVPVRHRVAMRDARVLAAVADFLAS